MFYLREIFIPKIKNDGKSANSLLDFGYLADLTGGFTQEPMTLIDSRNFFKSCGKFIDPSWLIQV